MAEQVPYRELGTRQGGRMSARAGVLLGLIILAAGAGLIAVGWFLESELKTYPLVIGFGSACLGLSLMLNGAIDWMRGR
ncbi:MAG TPA: hypothetical protein VGP99_07805 [Tepidisphaeraceae bacterium]|nr:hypothetical protein [Tepidisphaeraceae bacterium]